MSGEELVHLSKWYFRDRPRFTALRDGAACGHGSAHINITATIERVTCPECVETIPEVWREKVGVHYGR